jgi:glucosamine--fructose-6-phosphate aminotransferase (isomerizing)
MDFGSGDWKWRIDVKMDSSLREEASKMNPHFGINMQKEIASQPGVWKTTLDGYFYEQEAQIQFLAHAARKHILMAGCGTTYFLGLSAVALFRKLGFQATAYPASEIVFFPDTLPSDDATLLAVSRSGATSETLWAVDAFRTRYPTEKVITITTQPKSKLAEMSDFVFSAPAAQEAATAETRSFTSMFLLAQAMAGSLAGDRAFLGHLSALPPGLENLLNRYSELPRQIARDMGIQRFFFLGAGPLYGLACEAMIKVKEIACTWAEAYHPLEFRHGPMAVANQETLVTGFISDSAGEAEIRVLQDMHRLGAKTMAIIERAGDLDLSEMDVVVELSSGLNEWERAALYLPLIQYLAYYLGIENGLDPDRPNNLHPVTHL